MSYFVSAFLGTLGVRLKDVKTWLVLLLIPGLVAAAGMMFPAREMASPVQVGVALPPAGGEEMWALLEGCNNEVLTFIRADEDTIDRSIAAGRWDCGIVLGLNFEERLRALDTDGIIGLRIGPGSAVYPLVRESVSACMIQLLGPEIARDYLLESGIADDTTIAGMESRLQEVLDESDRVLVHMSTADGSPLAPLDLAREGMDAVLCWLISAVILVRLLLSATDLGAWINAPAVRRMTALRSPLTMMMARACADGLLLALSGSAAMALLGRGLWGCAAVWSYVLFWLAAAVLLARFPSVSGVLPVCVSFAVVLSLLLSSVLVDISLILPGLAGVCRWLPVTLFLAVCRGQWPAALCLTAAAAACFALAALTFMKKK